MSPWLVPGTVWVYEAGPGQCMHETGVLGGPRSQGPRPGGGHQELQPTGGGAQVHQVEERAHGGQVLLHLEYDP